MKINSTTDLSGFTSRMLDVGTGMVPKATADALKAASGPLFDALAFLPFFDDGWILVVPRSGHDGQNQEVAEIGHPELADLLRFARANGFDYLKLDVDGGLIAGLPSFDW